MNEPEPSTWYKVPYLTASHYCEVYPGITYFQKVPDQPEGKSIYKRQENDIKEFSNKSRVRALQRLNMIDPERLHVPHFVTLTYHNNFPSSARDIKTELDKFLKRLTRALPGFFYFWRIELQERGAPHFHFILWQDRSRAPLQAGFLRNTFRFIWTKYNLCNCHHCRSNSVKIDVVDDMRKATYYTAKYLSKSEKVAHEIGLGRLWGSSRDLPLSRLQFYSGHTDFVTMLQYSSILFSLQYTMSNPLYLSTLFSRPSMFLFIPGKVVEELRNQISKASPDPVRDACKVLGIEKRRSLESLIDDSVAVKIESPSASETSGSSNIPAQSASISYALHAQEILRRYSEKYK